MTWLYGAMFGGESLDNDLEVISAFRSSACTVDSTAAYIESGARCVKIPLATSAAKAILPATGQATDAINLGDIFVLSGYMGAAGAFSSEAGLISNDTQGDDRFVRAGTDMLLRVYDAAGTQIGAASNNVLPTAARKHFAFVFDNAYSYNAVDPTHPTTLIALYINKKWEHTFMVSSTIAAFFGSIGYQDICWGEWLAAATNRGNDLFLDDGFGRFSSTDKHDSPFVTNFPVLHMVGSASLPPTAAGSHTAWTGAFGDVDEFPNDGGVTTVNTLIEGDKETFKYSAANPVTSSMTIAQVSLRLAAAVASGAKTGCSSMLRDASANEVDAPLSIGLGTTFVGNTPLLNHIARPAGGSWVYTDFDLTTGVSNLQFGVTASAVANASPLVSNITGPEIGYYTEVLELAVSPWRVMPMMCGVL